MPETRKPVPAKPGSAAASRLKAYWHAVRELIPRLSRGMIAASDAAFGDDEPIRVLLVGWNAPENGVRRALRLSFAFDVAVRCLKAHATGKPRPSVQLLPRGTVWDPHGHQAVLRPDDAVARLIEETRLSPEIAEAVWQFLFPLLQAGLLDMAGLKTDASDPRFVTVTFNPACADCAP